MHATRLTSMTWLLAASTLLGGEIASAQAPKPAAPKAATMPVKPAAPGATKVEVLALHATKGLPGAPVKYDMMTARDPIADILDIPSFEVSMLLSRPDRNLIAFDAKASKLLSLTDDRKTELMKETGGIPTGFDVGNGEQSPFQGKIGEEGHRCLVRLRAPRTPAPGATKVTIKADLVLKCGTAEKAVEQKDFAPKLGSKVTVGPEPMEVGEGYGGDNLGAAAFGPGGVTGEMSIWLCHSAPTPPPAIKSIAFLDAEGNPIKSWVATPTASFGPGKPFQTQYGLEKKVDSLTVKVTYYEKVETLTVPVSIETGVGF